ncbi:MAG: DegQ family serine endoprotease [Alphaproteobacteria bacterium]|nr:DegQ family serine endoprotease [Alphaproteobacteria bacterium]
MLRSVKSAVGVYGLAFSLCLASPLPALAETAPAAGFADLAEKLLPSVVNISTVQKAGAQTAEFEDLMEGLPQLPPGSPFEEFFKEFKNQQQQRRAPSTEDNSQKVTSVGSGFIIDAAGYVVTNNHVIQDSDEITVTLHDNTTLKAELIGYDKKTDLAVLKVKPEKPLSAAKWGDSDKARVGDWVVAIGNPYAFGGTVTAGILSARARDIQSGPYDDYLQTDAAINRGNSGGPMFNLAGEVIGVNTAIISPTGGSVGIGFAIPASLAKNVVDQLKSTGHTQRGWFGVRIQGVTQEIADSLGMGKPRGAMISSANADGPADKAGIKNGDVVLTFDGKEVTEMRRLPRVVAETAVGKTVPVTVWRDGKEITLNVKLGELESHEKAEEKTEKKLVKSSEPNQAGKESVDEIGVSVGALTAEYRKKFGIKPDVKGLIVLEVKPGSKAAERGLMAGDVILEIAQQEVSSTADITKGIKTAKEKGKPLLLLVSREGDARFVALPLSGKDDKKGDK